MAGDSDRRAYDTGASEDAQGNIRVVIARLEEVIAARDGQVKAAMADFSADGVADGVADEYHGKELQWNRTSQEVRNIIQLLKTTREATSASKTTTGSWKPTPREARTISQSANFKTQLPFLCPAG